MEDLGISGSVFVEQLADLSSRCDLHFQKVGQALDLLMAAKPRHLEVAYYRAKAEVLQGEAFVADVRRQWSEFCANSLRRINPALLGDSLETACQALRWATAILEAARAGDARDRDLRNRVDDWKRRAWVDSPFAKGRERVRQWIENPPESVPGDEDWERLNPHQMHIWLTLCLPSLQLQCMRLDSSEPTDVQPDVLKPTLLHCCAGTFRGPTYVDSFREAIRWVYASDSYGWAKAELLSDVRDRVRRLLAEHEPARIAFEQAYASRELAYAAAPPAPGPTGSRARADDSTSGPKLRLVDCDITSDKG